MSNEVAFNSQCVFGYSVIGGDDGYWIVRNRWVESSWAS